MKIKQTKNKANRKASRATQHPAMKIMARLGFVVTGLLHMMIGWIAVRIATGSGGGEASNSGAMAEITSRPGGQIFLWCMTVGLLALGLWRLLSAFLAEEKKNQAKAAILGIVYLTLGFSAFRFAKGGSSSDGQQSSSLTAQLLGIPGGKAIIVLGGLIILGVGVYGIIKGSTRKFVEDLESGAEKGKVGSGIILAGIIGYVARGVAFLVLGGLVGWAAVFSDPEKASGMDAALRTIGQQPFGAVLLSLVALGFMLYGIYSIARAKYTSEI